MNVRSTPYPVPPSLAWSGTMFGVYLALALAGALVLTLLVVAPQPIGGVLVLGLWGGLTLPASLLGLWGVTKARYRYEWLGTWLLSMGTTIYLTVTAVNTAALGMMTLIMSAPTLLIFLAFIGLILARAVQLSIVDFRAREQVLVEKARTGEIAEVIVDD